jgi:biotin transport system substrate-specific component
LKVRNLVLVALFAALTAIGAFVKIPMPIAPITLQTLFCIMAGMLLGPGLGSLSQVVYVAIGLLGVPVFTGGGGIGYIVQPSFGYLIGLIAVAFLSGFIAKRFRKKNFIFLLLAAIAGMMAVYSVGVPYLYVIRNLYQHQGLSVANTLYYGLVLFIPGDALKCLMSTYLVMKIQPILASVKVVPKRV